MQPFASELLRAEKFGHREVDVVVPRLIISITAKRTFCAKCERRESGRWERPVRNLLRARPGDERQSLACWASRGLSRRVLVTAGIADYLAIGVEHRVKAGIGVHGKRQPTMQQPQAAKPLYTQNIAGKGVIKVVGKRPGAVHCELLADVVISPSILAVQVAVLNTCVLVVTEPAFGEPELLKVSSALPKV